MAYGYSGPGLAVGALSSAVGDYFKKQLESEMAIPQLQQTMEALNQMKLAGLQRQAMAPLQMAQMQQGLQKGQMQLGFMPEQQGFERAQAAQRAATAGREQEAFEHQKGTQWPAEQFRIRRYQEAVGQLQALNQHWQGRIPPNVINQLFLEYGDVLGKDNPASRLVEPPGLAEQRLARAQREEAWAGALRNGTYGRGAGSNVPGGTWSQQQNAVTATRRQAEIQAYNRMNEFHGIPNANFGTFQERQEAYDWLTDHYYRQGLADRGMSQHLGMMPPQKPMPTKLGALMGQVPPSESGGPSGFGFVNRAYDWFMGPNKQPAPQQPGQPPAGVPGIPKPAGFGQPIPQIPEAPPNPMDSFIRNPQYHIDTNEPEETPRD